MDDLYETMELGEEVKDSILAEHSLREIFGEAPPIAILVVTLPLRRAVVGDEPLETLDVSGHSLQESLSPVAEVHPSIESVLHLTYSCDASFVHILSLRMH